MHLRRWIAVAGLLVCCSPVSVEALEAPRPSDTDAWVNSEVAPVEVEPPATSESAAIDAGVERIAPEVDDAPPPDAPPPDAPPPDAPAPDAASTSAPVPLAALGPAPVLMASTVQGNLRSFDRRGQAIGQGRVGGIARGLRHDRRAKDGYWVLLEAEPGILMVKFDWSGRELRRFVPQRRELLEARRLRGLDYVYGHQPSTDLLLLLYDNVRGLPVVEGINAQTGETRFATRFSAGDFVGLRAETYRHGPGQSLIMLEWWVARDGQSLELWRYDRGFLSLQDRRRLPLSVSAFDLPPWRELWGANEQGMVRVQPDGAPGPTVPLPDWSAGAISIDQ